MFGATSSCWTCYGFMWFSEQICCIHSSNITCKCKYVAFILRILPANANMLHSLSSPWKPISSKGRYPQTPSYKTMQKKKEEKWSGKWKRFSSWVMKWELGGSFDDEIRDKRLATREKWSSPTQQTSRKWIWWPSLTHIKRISSEDW